MAEADTYNDDDAQKQIEFRWELYWTVKIMIFNVWDVGYK
jgi:hypothetical protein